MKYTWHYLSPLGDILLACDKEGLTGLWFEGQKYYAAGLERDAEERPTAFFEEACRWLDIYFGGEEPDFMPVLHLIGTGFQRSVWEELLRIPYGAAETYGQIAAALYGDEKHSSFAARAVGGAVGHNRISIMIPCHRVVGADGSLTGYAGGIERKKALLRLEKADVANNR